MWGAPAHLKKNQDIRYLKMASVICHGFKLPRQTTCIKGRIKNLNSLGDLGVVLFTLGSLGHHTPQHEVWYYFNRNVYNCKYFSKRALT